MRTIVTGGAGFIGSTLVDRLLADGHDVVAIDNFEPFYAESIKRANLAGALSHRHFRLIEADLRDRDAIRRAVAEVAPDAILHLAAKAGVRPSIDHPSLYVDVNVRGTSHLLEAASEMAVTPKFIYASSSSVYGDRPDAPFRETRPRRSPGQSVRGHQEGLRTPGSHLPPPSWPSRDRPAVLHGLRSPEPSRPGHRQVRPPDRPRRAHSHVRRRDNPARLHLC